MVSELERHSFDVDVEREEILVIAIGASAGGLEALESFFRHVHPQSNASYIVLQHLSLNHPSMMGELLARQTNLTITTADNDQEVEPNRIYLLPPGKEMIISQRRLLLADRDPHQEMSMPIDRFFRSLAQDIGSKAVAVVLSGTGSDGSRGIVDVHANGGLVLTQSEETARFDGMPRMANDTGVVDAVLSPEEMPNAILQMASTNAEKQTRLTSSEPVSSAAPGLTSIFRMLRSRYGIDFSLYKQSMIVRRIERRLMMVQADDIDAYAQMLEESVDELSQLCKDLLIGVTRFFRDPVAFSHLEEDILPPLLTQVQPESEFRVWIPGTGTGEEAYSIAMLISEQLDNLPTEINVKIFATDVHEESLRHAAKGVYSGDALQGIGPLRLARFFTQKEDGYHVSSQLRRMIVFAHHNVVRDAPFTSLDLISCRNMLIYFRQPAQMKTISLFHFGLNSEGILWLGPSESVGTMVDDFDAISTEWKTFRKRNNVSASVLGRNAASPTSRILGQIGSSPAGGRSVPPFLLETYDKLLDEFMPTSILINEQREIVHTLAGASEYLEHRSGRPSPDILDQVKPELRHPLSTAIQRAVKERAPVVFTGIPIEDEDSRDVRLTVRPFFNRSGNRYHFLVMFESAATVERDESATEEISFDRVSAEKLPAIEAELRYTKESLQATIQELESTNEELQAANEELVASNEELQSTNEELHSVNEELYTVNAEHQRKIAELTELTDDMDNLLVSTNIDTVFLDRELRIRKFTPGIAKTFNLIPQDIGRRIDNFTHNLPGAPVLDLLSQVVESNKPVESDVRDHLGNWFLLRIQPYRSKQQIDGVVMTIIDVSMLKQTEAKLRELSEIVEQSADAIFRVDLDGSVRTWNRGAFALLGYAPEEIINRNVSLLVPEFEEAKTHKLLYTAAEGNTVRDTNVTWHRKDESTIDISLYISPIRNEDGNITGLSAIGRDITEMKRASEEIRLAINRRDEFLAMLSHELRNPFSAILNATSLLKEKTLDEESALEAREVLEHQLHHISRLLDDLLDVARITNGKLSIHKEQIDLGKLILDIVDCVQHLIEENGHRLYVDPPETPLFVNGDLGRLQQAQVNLIVNACKYSERGSRIWYSVKREGSEAIIRIKDEGDGIAPAVKERIFEPFIQSEQALDRSQGGMGLGLALVRMIADAHGGQVDVESEGVGKGSEFTMRLPISNAVAQKPNIDFAKFHFDRFKVVLIEDNDGIRRMLSRSLELKGFQVASAARGIEGLELITEFTPDVAIVDIGLPDLTGYEIASRIREELDLQELVLVAVTGYGRDDDRRNAYESGFDAHLVKPIDPMELITAISAFLTDSPRRQNANSNGKGGFAQ